MCVCVCIGVCIYIYIHMHIIDGLWKLGRATGLREETMS